MKIACIEDQPEFTYYMKLIFREDEFFSFSEVNEFVDRDYDVVFTDLRLRETWGDETIKELFKKTNKPIIVLTGLGGSELTGTQYAGWLEAGATEVFSKDAPRDPDFKQRVQEIIEKFNVKKQENFIERRKKK